MFKKIVTISVIIYLVVSYSNTRFEEYRIKKFDQNMEKIVAEMNGKLPITDDSVRINGFQVIKGDLIKSLDQVEYSNHVVRFYGTLREELPQDVRMNFYNHLRNTYCGGVLHKGKVTIEYSMDHVVLRNINDEVRRETVLVGVGPGNCG
jgi:hypothetical protein